MTNYTREDTKAYGNRLVSWLKTEGVASDEATKYFMSDAPREAKYAFASALRETENSGRRHSYGGAHSADDEIMHLVPYTEKNGSFSYVDRMTGKVVVSMRKQENGLFTYFGPKKWMEMLGGRGMMGSLLDRVEDGDFFRNSQKK